MKKHILFTFLFSVMLVGSAMAQDLEQEDRPQRTPEEEALKQTTRIFRELGIVDSVRFDTIYRMHLKYARIRQKGLTRAENMQRMQAIHDELKKLLSPEEFDLFMNQPAETPHRRLHGTGVLLPAKQASQTEDQPGDLL